MIVEASKNRPVNIGRLGENEARIIKFPVGDLENEFPGCSFLVLHRRKNDQAGYPVPSANYTVQLDHLYWTIMSGDVAQEGSGECQIVAMLDSKVMKTDVYVTIVGKALDGSGTAPDPWQGWVQGVKDDADRAEAAAGVAAHAPIIQDGYWYTWDATTEQYVNSEVKAQGEDGDPGQDATPALITVDYSELTFPVAEGKLCYHSGLLYKANQAIATSETWTEAHWTQTTIEEELRALKTEINSTASDVNEISEAYGTSRNIFDDTELKAGSGITFSNGEYSGTANDLYSIGKMMDGDFEQDTRYTFSLYAVRHSGTVSTGNGICIQIVYTDNSTKTIPISNGTDEYTRFYVASDSGKSVSGIKFTYDAGMNNVWHLKMLQVEKGTSPTDYVEPGGNGLTAVDFVARGAINDLQNDVDQIEEDASTAKNDVEKISKEIMEDVPGTEDLSDGFITGHYIKTGVSVGSTVDLTPLESNGYTSIVADCEAGDIFTVTVVGGGNARAWAFIDSTNKLLSVSDSYKNVQNLVLTAPTNAKKIVCGGEKTSPHVLIKAITLEEPIKIKKVYNAFVDSDQMFDKSTIIAGKKYSSGEIVDDAEFYLSDYIPIKPSTTYAYRGVNGAVNYFDKDKNYLSAVSFNGYDQVETQTSVAGAYYCRIQLKKEYFPYDAVVMNEGNTGSKQFVYGKLLKEENREFKPYAYSDMPIPTEYTAVGVKAVDGSAGTDFDNDNPSLTDVYNAFDDLVTNYPNYVSKSDLGTDQSDTYHIYAYYFTPEEMTAGSTYYRLPYPKINLLAGIHGSRECCENIFALYYLMKSLCDNWDESDALEYLRWNVRFAIVPIQNPYGFVNGTRGNSRGVDLNRNFGIGWKSTTQDSGSAPMSEAETNIIAAFGEANKDAIFTVDLHGTGNEAVGQDSMIYIGTGPTDDIFYMLKSVMTKVSHLWDSQNIAGLNKANFHGFISGSIEGDGMERAYMHDAVGINSCVLESFMNFSGSQYSDNSEEIMQMNADKLGYFILYGLMHFKK